MCLLYCLETIKSLLIIATDQYPIIKKKKENSKLKYFEAYKMLKLNALIPLWEKWEGDSNLSDRYYYSSLSLAPNTSLEVHKRSTGKA